MKQIFLQNMRTMPKQMWHNPLKGPWPRLLSFVALLFFCFSAQAQVSEYAVIVTIGGEGCSAAPSLSFVGMLNGKPSYSSNDDYNFELYWSTPNVRWETSSYGNLAYTNTANTPTPPATGWTGCDDSFSLTGGEPLEPECNLTVFDVTGGGIYCPGSPGVQVGLTGRQEGVEYHFFKNFEETGQFSTYDPDYEEIVDIPWSSNFDEFSFESISDLAGEYTIVAVNASDFSCTVTMNGSATISLSEDPAVMYYADNDNDGFGFCELQENKSSIEFIDCSLLSCIAVDGYVTNNDDCDDTNVNVNPEEEEVTTNNIDDDCDGEIDEGGTLNLNWTVNGTCGYLFTFSVDAEPAAPLGTTYQFSGTGISYTFENFCQLNFVPSGLQTYSVTVTQPNGTTAVSSTQINVQAYYTFWPDNDDDGFGSICPVITDDITDANDTKSLNDTWCTQTSCASSVEGYSLTNDDCNDNNPNIYPEATELLNQIDDDCDELIDEGLSVLSWNISETPCGAFFSFSVSLEPSVEGTTYQFNGPALSYTSIEYAGAQNVPAGMQTYSVTVTNSQGTTVSSVTVNVQESSTYYYDGDGDGYGTLFCDFGDILTGPTNTSSNITALDVTSGVALEFNTEKGGLSCSYKACSAEDGYVTNNLDCDDNNPAINPEATDASCDGVDQNCNETKDEGYVSVPCDGADADLCVEGTTSCPNGSVVCSDMTPANVEVCNNIDDDCDAAVDEGVLVTFYADTDGDGFYGTNAATTTACTAPTGFVAANKSGDCQPTNNSIFPTAIEVCNGVDDNCDNVSELNAACSTPTVTMAPVINGNNVTFNWLKGCFKSYRVQFRRTTPANSTWTLRLVNSPNVLSLFVPTMGAGTYTWGVKGQCYSSNQFSSAGMGSNFTIGSTNPGFSPVGVSNKIIAAYPNPANKNLVVQIDANEDKACFIRLCDQMGKTAYGQHHEVDGISSVNIPVNHLAEGIYFLQVIVGADVQTQKIVVSH